MHRFSSSPIRRHVGSTSLVATLAIVALSGCSEAASRPVADPLHADPKVSAAPAPMPVAAPSGDDWSGTITIARLVAAAEAHHPTAAAVEAARAAAQAQIRQAGAWANPELELSYGRTKPRVADLERDTPYGGSLSQRLTWWGARQARVAAAQAQAQAVAAEGAVARLGLQADVRRAAILYAAAVDSATQAADDARIAAELAAQTKTRHEAGETDRASLARADLESTTTALHRDARQREVVTALAVLRSWCGNGLPDGVAIADALNVPATVSDPAQLGVLAERHPQLRALAEAAVAAQASVTAERESRIPDLTVGVFADREAEKDGYGVTVGIDLPLWNRNEAGIAAAEAQQARLRAATRAERLRLRRDLVEALGVVQTAISAATALAQQAVPVANEVIQLRTAAYQSGEASLSDLLEARRAANAVRAELRDARQRAALAVVDLGVAIGDPALGGSSSEPVRP